MARAKETTPASHTTYFREQFQRNPSWLKVKSNQAALDQWKTDHPGEEINQQVKTALQNAKTTEKAKQGVKGKKGKRKKEAPSMAEELNLAVESKELERLELLIDDCLAMARTLEDRKLKKAINHLRAARNQVILQQGED